MASWAKPIKLIYEDNQSKPDETATVVHKLISRDKVVALLGEVASGRSLIAAPICQQNHVPHDFAVFHESQSDGSGRLYFSRLLYRSISGQVNC